MSVLERGVVWNLLEFQQVSQIGEVGKELNDPAVVGFEELSQDQHGKKLMLGKDFLRELAGIRRQRFPGGPQGHPGQRYRRTRHGSFGFHES